MAYIFNLDLFDFTSDIVIVAEDSTWNHNTNVTRLV